MKRNVIRGILLVLVLAVLPWGGAALGEGTPRKLTVLFYMCGSNLESKYGAASSDIQEMLDAGGPGAGVSVLLMTGGTRRWSMGYDPGQCQIQELGRRGMRTVWRSEAVSMGSGDTLTALLKFGMDHYPAEDYALIFWDHGGGPLEGVCWDELFSLDNLSLEELKRGIEGAELGKKLRFIGFDACLMGSLEVAGALAPYADYMIASQETEPAGGWNYGFLSGLTGEEDPVETAKRIVDKYMETKVLAGEVLTLSCLDLRYADAAVQALGDSFAPRAAGMDAERFAKLAGERSRAVAFGAPLKGFGEGGYDLVDLADLAERMGSGEALRAALDRLVVYTRSNRSGPHGVSVYHPCFNKEKFRDQWRGSYKRLEFSEAYTRYIESYGRFLLGEDAVDWSGLVPVAGPLSEGRQGFSLKLDPAQAGNLDSAQLLVMLRTGKSYALVGSFPATLGEDGLLTAEYDGRALFIEGPEVIGPLGYLLGADGSSLVTTVTYVPDGAVLHINDANGISVLTGDGSGMRQVGLGTDTTPNVYYYVGEGPEGARIEQVRIRDEATGMLTNRTAFSGAGSRGMVLWYPLKDMPEPDDRGLLPEYALWDDTAGMYGVTMALPADWRFSIRRGARPGQPLCAAFQLTDVRQNTWCTPPVAVENPNLIPLEVRDFDAGVARATLCAGSEPGVRIEFELNGAFEVADLVVNGLREVPGRCATPEGTGSVFIKAGNLAGLERLERLGFTLTPRDGGLGERFELPLAGNLRGIAPAAAALGSETFAGYAWELLSMTRNSDGIEAIIKIKNLSGGSAAVETVWPVVNGAVQLAGDCRVTLPGPGRERVEALSLRTRNRLRWVGDHFHMGDTGVDIVEYRLPDLLEVYGVTGIGQMGLMFRELGGQAWPVVTLPLDQNWELPDAPAPDSLWTLFRTLCEDGAEPLPLISGPALEVELDHLLVGLNGIGVLLRARNTTDAPVTLTVDAAEIDGREVVVGRYFGDNERVVAPRAETVVVFTVGVGDDALGAVQALKLSLRCGDGEPAWVSLRLDDRDVPAVGPLQIGEQGK